MVHQSGHLRIEVSTNQNIILNRLRFEINILIRNLFALDLFSLAKKIQANSFPFKLFGWVVHRELQKIMGGIRKSFQKGERE